jgi:alpha-L-fucosidase 2
VVNGGYQGIACSRVTAARALAHDQLRSRHVADYQALFGRVSIDLGRTAVADQPTDVRVAQHATVNDPQFSALLFPFGRYLLISSARPGTQPANLQGVWNDSLSPRGGTRNTPSTPTCR